MQNRTDKDQKGERAITREFELRRLDFQKTSVTHISLRVQIHSSKN